MNIFKGLKNVAFVKSIKKRGFYNDFFKGLKNAKFLNKLNTIFREPKKRVFIPYF